jgi:hypothetical protein
MKLTPELIFAPKQTALVRLPTDSEILKNCNYPSQAGEKQLRELFTLKFREIILEYLSEKVPNYQVGEDMDAIIHFFYGIYIANYLLKGKVINHRNRLSTENLADWPFNQISIAENLKDARVQVVGYIQKIDLSVNIFKLCTRYPKINLRVRTAFTNAYPHTVEPRLSYELSLSEHALIISLEEAFHVAEFKKEAADFEKFGKSSRTYENLIDFKLEEKGIVIDYLLNRDPDNLVSYSALLGIEFSAHLFVADFVKRYLPHVWESGYAEFNKSVLKKRKAGKVSRASVGLPPLT